MSELLPCPYHKEAINPDLESWPLEDGWCASIVCQDCGCIKYGTGDTREQAIAEAVDQWNTRYERTCRPIWKQSKQQGRLMDTCECSECGGCLDDLTRGYNAGFFPYCPLCGAKVVDE